MNISSSVVGLAKQSRIYSANEHGLNIDGISIGASRVMEQLLSSGFEAYLVGGGVRDLLLRRNPTDFDVATNATPIQISKIFRRSRTIGRRFKLVHVRMNSEIIEVATFRKSPRSENCLKETGIIFRDNDFGNIEDDVVRRDYTLNALYLDYATMDIHDFVGGIDDLNNGILRLIGDPKARFCEDPVRVLRAVRFSESFGLEMAGFSSYELREYGKQLKHIPPARLFGEMNKLFLRGVANRTFKRLKSLGLLCHLLPLTECFLNAEKDSVVDRFIESALLSTDQRVGEGGPVTTAFLMAVFLWWPLINEKEKMAKLGHLGLEGVVLAEDSVLMAQLEKVAIPRRVTKSVKEIWQLQNVFTNPSKRRAEKIVKHPRLRAAYSFFCLRVDAGELPVESLGWWSDFFKKSMKLGKLPFSDNFPYRSRLSK